MKTMFLSAVVLAAVSVSADTVVWGDPNVNGSVASNIPFGSGEGNDGYQRVQTVYEASLFGNQPIPIAITAIAFREDQNLGRTVDWEIPSVQVVLSTTDGGPNMLSPSFAQNLSSDAAVAMISTPFRLQHTLVPGVVQPFAYRLNFPQPFIYSPARGNLLVDMVVRGGTSSGSWIDAEIDSKIRQVLGREGPEGGCLVWQHQ